jgi:hypothetical protein
LVKDNDAKSREEIRDIPAVQQVTLFPGKPLRVVPLCRTNLKEMGEDYWIEELKAAQEVEKHFAKARTGQIPKRKIVDCALSPYKQKLE